LIGEGGERGRIKRQINAPAGRAQLQLRKLIEVAYVELVIEDTDHGYSSNRVRISKAGKQDRCARPRKTGVRLERISGPEELTLTRCVLRCHLGKGRGTEPALPLQEVAMLKRAPERALTFSITL
jgi:hypothetical protein